ncbi:unnamed protein product, partial [Ilex paraguariensis]
KSERKMQDSESDKEMQDGEDILAKPLVTIEDVIHIKSAPWWTPMDFMARVGSVVRVKLEEREKLVEERVKNMNPSATDSVPDHSKSERKMQDSGKEMQDGKDIPAKPLVTIEDVIGIKPEPWWTPMDYMAIVASVAGFKLEEQEKLEEERVKNMSPNATDSVLDHSNGQRLKIMDDLNLSPLSRPLDVSRGGQNLKEQMTSETPVKTNPEGSSHSNADKYLKVRPPWALLTYQGVKISENKSL